MSTTIDVPKRSSLAAQAAASIRKAIAEGAWKEYLPGERRLCALLHVSRPTVRVALNILAKECAFEVRPSRRKRLIKRPTSPRAERSRLVVLVTQAPVAQMATIAAQSISELRAHLAEQGFTTEVLICPPENARTQRRKLGDFLRRNPLFCAVLLSVPRSVQEWFATQPVPTLVIGSCHPDVNLPSFDVDYRAVCRHAAGVLLGKGHRHLALVVPNSGLAGDLASERGFQEALNRHPETGRGRATVVRHNGTAPQISAKLDALFNSAQPPTALLVAKPQHVFIVIMYLLKRGLTVPDRISLIARDSDHLFEITSPPIAHYTFGNESFAHRLSRLMLRMVGEGFLPAGPTLMFPQYFAGGTVQALD